MENHSVNTFGTSFATLFHRALHSKPPLRLFFGYFFRYLETSSNNPFSRLFSKPLSSRALPSRPLFISSLLGLCFGTHSINTFDTAFAKLPHNSFFAKTAFEASTKTIFGNSLSKHFGTSFTELLITTPLRDTHLPGSVLFEHLFGTLSSRNIPWNLFRKALFELLSRSPQSHQSHQLTSPHQPTNPTNPHQPTNPTNPHTPCPVHLPCIAPDMERR